MFEYTIERGAVQVSGVYPVIDHDDVKIIEVDLSSKYPGDVYHGNGPALITVYIPAVNHTLGVDLDAGRDRDTGITFRVPDTSDWAVVAYGARYTVRIVLYRLPRILGQGPR